MLAGSPPQTPMGRRHCALGLRGAGRRLPEKSAPSHFRPLPSQCKHSTRRLRIVMGTIHMPNINENTHTQRKSGSVGMQTRGPRAGTAVVYHKTSMDHWGVEVLPSINASCRMDLESRVSHVSLTELAKKNDLFGRPPITLPRSRTFGVGLDLGHATILANHFQLPRMINCSAVL
ncbi:hypothetical protein BDZ91DRAFT_302001 [Kalaharituber pfeilii]|nr:hypothetical protein BDZ91DRAFT_302001 [Kalaharituber pfeilii]